MLAISVAPLVPWTIRNWRDFHRFQPLVPQSASDPDEFVPDGFDKWVRTWAADYVSTEEVYWQVSGDKVDLDLLPSRAFDSAQEREQTQSILADYNKVLVVNPAVECPLHGLGRERIRRNPLRYYVWLPALAHRRHVAASAHRDASAQLALVGVRRRHQSLRASQRCGAC